MPPEYLRRVRIYNASRAIILGAVAVVCLPLGVLRQDVASATLGGVALGALLSTGAR